MPDELLAVVGLCLGTQRCCVGVGEVSGSSVSEGVCEAPTFIEWSTMVLIPTYPLKVATTP
jgi:hypothetical protein